MERSESTLGRSPTAVLLARSYALRKEFRCVLEPLGFSCVDGQPSRSGLELLEALPARLVVLDPGPLASGAIRWLTEVDARCPAARLLVVVPDGDVTLAVECKQACSRCVVLELPLDRAKAASKVADVRGADVRRGTHKSHLPINAHDGTQSGLDPIRLPVLVELVRRAWNLTPSQSIVANGELQARSDKEHADALGCSERRAAAHIRALLRKGECPRRRLLPLFMVRSVSRVYGLDALIEAGVACASSQQEDDK